jgi:hypothetical protein
MDEIPHLCAGQLTGVGAAPEGDGMEALARAADVDADGDGLAVMGHCLWKRLRSCWPSR